MRRIPDAVLAEMLRRLAIAVSAGIDLRRSLDAEASRVPRRWRPAVRQIAGRVTAGEQLGEACAAGAMPDHVAAMLLVGDRTGRLAEVLDETARTIARSLAARRALRAGLVGPVLRLVLACGVIVLVIMVGGLTHGVDGSPFDLLGLGLVGGRGAATFLGMVAIAIGTLAVAGVAAWRSWRHRGWAWQLGRRLPIVGPAVVAADAAAWCRAAALAAHAGVGVGEMVELASRAAAGFGFSRSAVEAGLRRGQDLAETLAATGRLPQTVIEAVAVGEATGMTAEALDRVADRLEEAAAQGLAAAVQAAGLLAWAIAACAVAVVVIRVAATYARMIDDLARPR